MAQTQRRRPMTREEALARQQRMQRLREKEEESRELARGPIDLPFCLLVILLTGIGLVMRFRPVSRRLTTSMETLRITSSVRVFLQSRELPPCS